MIKIANAPACRRLNGRRNRIAIRERYRYANDEEADLKYDVGREKVILRGRLKSEEDELQVRVVKM